MTPEFLFSDRALSPAAFFREVHRRSPALSVTGWINIALFAAMLLTACFDSRQIMGINAWIKPIKFAISIAIYVWTVAWLLAYAHVSPRVKRTIAGGIWVASHRRRISGGSGSAC